MAEDLLAQMAGDFFRAAIPEGNVVLTIDKVNAHRQFGENSSIDFEIVDHGCDVDLKSSAATASGVALRMPLPSIGCGLFAIVEWESKRVGDKLGQANPNLEQVDVEVGGLLRTS
jgi:hypothetical protein